jgi:hypothetical protein
MLKSKFYANVGHDDCIRLPGRDIPLYEFLEFYLKPEGWLLSLSYKHKTVPSGHKQWDCGARTYLELEVPMIAKSLVTPQWILNRIKAVGDPGDIAIAPDHILSPKLQGTFGGDYPYQMAFRRRFNRDSAEEFLEISRDTGFVPMAVCHGLSIPERIVYAEWLYKIGYRYIAVGGLVPSASNLQYCVNLVAAIRKALPADCAIHVLGLNSPRYAEAWTRLGIESFDGCTYQQMAIRKNKWLLANGHKLEDYDVVHPGETPIAPTCECPVCERLQLEGFDSRTSGTRQANYGRIAHNLGQQIAAHRNIISRKRITLVSCVDPKLDHPVPAKQLYNSQWWRAARRYVEVNNHNWYAISAKHGIVHPDTVLEPYDQTLRGKGVRHRREWSERVVQQLESIAAPGAEIVFLTGRQYREFVVPTLLTQPDRLWTAQTPLAGLNGIGYQLQFFKQFTPPHQRLFI